MAVRSEAYLQTEREGVQVLGTGVCCFPINGQLRKMLMVVRMRRSPHSIDMHEEFSTCTRNSQMMHAGATCRTTT